MRERHRLGSGTCLFCVLLCGAVVESASARIYTIGSPLIESSEASISGPAVATWLNSSLSAPGANVTSPVTGTVIRWRTRGAFKGGPFKLRVLRPGPAGVYTAMRSSAPQTPSGSETSVFPTRLLIEAGSTIGIDTKNASDQLGTSSPAGPGNAVAMISPPLLDYGPAALASATADPYEIGFNADILPPPRVTGISSTSGSYKGGGPLTLVGENFTEVTSVNVGANAAAFTPEGEGRVSAVVPRSKLIGPLSVSVTTLAGSGLAPQLYDYEGCRVPKLKNQKPKNARKQIRRAGCRIGKVKRIDVDGPRTGRVAKQSPDPGKLLPLEARVNFRLG